MSVHQENYIGKPISSLQQMLRRISFRDTTVPRVAETGTYDAATEDAVRQYQQTRNLTVTGTTDKDTWNNIYAEFRNIVSSEHIVNWPLYGDWRLAVSQDQAHPIMYLAQAMFVALSDLMPLDMNVRVTGINDDETTGAIMWLQNRTGLTADGIMDKYVWENLSGLFYVVFTREFDYLPRPYSAASFANEG